MSTSAPKQNLLFSRSTTSNTKETEQAVQKTDNENATYTSETIELMQMCFTEQELIGNEQINTEYSDLADNNVANTLARSYMNTNKNMSQTETHLSSSSSPSSQSPSQTPARTATVAEQTTTFDANKFIQQKQTSGVSMDVLRDDINTYINLLQAKIERYVNDDLYNSFVHVSGRFVGIPEELQSIHAPIKRLINEVEGISDTFTRLGNTLQLKLHEADEAESKRFFFAYYTEFLLLYSKLQEINNAISDKSTSEGVSVGKSFANSEVNSESKVTESLQKQCQQNSATEELELSNVKSIKTVEGQQQSLNMLQQLLLTIARLQTLRTLLLSCGEFVKELHEHCAEISRYAHSAQQVGLHQFQHAFSQLCTDALALNDARLYNIDTNQNALNTNQALSEEPEQQKEHLLKYESEYSEEKQEQKERTQMYKCTLNSHSQILENIQELVKVCRVTYGASVIKDVFRTKVLEPFFIKKYFNSYHESKDSKSVRSSSDTNMTSSALAILRKMYYDLQFNVLPLISVMTLRDTKSVEYPELTFLVFAREVIWPTVANLLISHLPSLFDIVDVDAFQQKYITAHALQMLLINSKLKFNDGSDDSENEVSASKMTSMPSNITKTSMNSTEESKIQNNSLTVIEEKWEEKWNVEIYATVRTGEMHRQVIAALEHVGQVSSKTDKVKKLEIDSNVVSFMLHCTNVLMGEIEWLFSPRVFLAACTPLFVREVVLCVYKLTEAMWRHYSSSDSEFALRDTDGTAANVNTLASNNMVNEDGNSNKNNNNNSNSDNSDFGKGSVKQRRLHFALCCVRDLITLDHYLDTKFVHLITNNLAHEKALLTEHQFVNVQLTEKMSNTELQRSKEPDTNSTISNTHSPQVAAITAVVSHTRSVCCHEYCVKLKHQVVHSVVDDCVVVLQNIKSVRSAYTHTKKPLPTSASWYVAGVVAPVTELIQLCTCCAFASAEMSDVVTVTVDRVMEEFLSISQETLLIAKRTEESWEKLRRRKEAMTANDHTVSVSTTATHSAINPPNTQRVTDASASDRDKMIMQLHLDAEAILSALAQKSSYAVPSAQVRERLRSLLRRAEWLHGADMDEPVDVNDSTNV